LFFSRVLTDIHAGITHIGGGSIMSFQALEDRRFLVEIAILDEDGAPASRLETVHEVVTCCGYRPDMSISEELQVGCITQHAMPVLSVLTCALL
jgi:hypothetical protein